MDYCILWIGFMFLGATIGWAQHLLFAMQRRPPESSLVSALSVAAGTMIFLGILGVLATFSWVVGIIIGGVLAVVWAMVVNRYRLHVGQTFLLQLSLARKFGFPLVPAAKSFAAERTDEIGFRVLDSIARLERGVPLGQSLRDARLPLASDSLLAAALGMDRPHWNQSIWEMSNEAMISHGVPIRLMQRLLYLLFLPLFGLFCGWFLVTSVLPSLAAVLNDFDMPLPPLTSFFISLSSATSESNALALVVSWLLVAGAVMLSLIAMAGVAYFAGWLRWEPPLIRRFTANYHGGIILRNLANLVESEADLETGFRELAVAYPVRYVRRRLVKTVDTVQRGEDWIESLWREGLIRRSVAGVLTAAERIHNLPWALREMSEATHRRLMLRAEQVAELLTPIILLSIAIPIACVAMAMIQPIAALINLLAS